MKSKPHVAPAEPEPLPEHYIEAHTSLVERPLRTLKEGDAFLVSDHYGDCGAGNESPQGLYFRDTRYLSRFELRMDGYRPLFLGSAIHGDNAVLSVDLTNPDTQPSGEKGIPRDTISVERTKFLWAGVCYERIGLRNYDSRHREFTIQIYFDADFRDLFELRGSARMARGKLTARVMSSREVEYAYSGLDGIVRRACFTFEPSPFRLDEHQAGFRVSLEPGERSSILAMVDCSEATRVAPADFRIALRDSRRRIRAARASCVTIESSNRLFDGVMTRCDADITMLLTQTPSGPYPYAGIPWFSTVFGRDGIITAIFLLWTKPAIALGVLRYLAAHQAHDFDPSADSQPGKILHESRNGEMANLGEVPFGHYYGSVDSTPLFLLLASLYFERTNDLVGIKELWPNLVAALAWCDTHGDRDGDGFIEYHRETPQGLANQGWKDSNDAVFHADGTLAEGPIALVEVQAYVFAAKRGLSRMATALGETALATSLRDQAEALRQKFEASFWDERLGTYALALDGAKRPCRIRSSNAGHALFCGIASPDRAARTAATLMTRDAFSGWGIRTVARGEARYNPMSYHNGSIWPHDNAIIAMGFARYGLKAEANRVFTALFEATTHQDLWRMPELYCGFIRRPQRGPTSYPVACSPQAWAAAAPLGCLAACLGLSFDHPANEIKFTRPHLPDFIDRLTLRGLTMGKTRADVSIIRGGDRVAVDVLTKSGDAKIA
jgi:glycogen debranching enzyme